MPFSRASTALERFTVLDLTRVRSGPSYVRQLVDWGANVNKIETPPHLEKGEGPGGPREGSDFQNLQRNKRDMTLDLKSPEGLAVFKRMSLSSCLEEILLHTNEPLGDGVASPHTKGQLAHIQRLKVKHGIDYDSHGSYRFVE